MKKMFRIFSNRASLEPLLKSSLYDESSFYRAFFRDLKQSKKEIIIESPYMTLTRVSVFIPTFRKLIKRGVKVRVNTRYPGHHNKCLRSQSWQASQNLKLIGVKVKFLNDYNHRKISVIDDHILWEGSLNILSQSRSREIMRRIDSIQLSKQMISYLGLKRYFW